MIVLVDPDSAMTKPTTKLKVEAITAIVTTKYWILRSSIIFKPITVLNVVRFISIDYDYHLTKLSKQARLNSSGKSSWLNIALHQKD
ncbi:MAG: hypothetical protein WBL68_01660 [Nitrososphaeraceae archaeon]